MNKEKGFLRYILWALYTVIVCFSLVIMIILLLPSPMNRVLKVGASFLVLFAVGGIYFLARFCVKKAGRASQSDGKRKNAFEIIFCLLIFSAFVGYFIFNYYYLKQPFSFEENFAERYLSGEAVTIPDFYCGAEWLYALFLNSVYYVAGADIQVGLLLHLIIIVAGAVLFYFGVRNIFGVLSALLTVAFTFLVSFLRYREYFFSPFLITYFLTGLFLFISGIVIRRKVSGSKLSTRCFCFLGLGFLYSLFVFIDFKNLAFLPVFMLILSKGDEKENSGIKIRHVFSEFLSWLAGTCFGIFVLSVIGCNSYNISFRSLWVNWFSTFRVSSPDNFFSYVENNPAVLMVIFLLLLFGVFNFFQEKNNLYEMDAVYFMFLLLCVIFSMHLIFNGLNAAWLTFMLSVLAFVCLGRSLDCKISVPGVKHQPEPEPVKSRSDENSDGENMDKPRVKLLESPLPGPKKHVSRILDYDFKVNPENCHYDISVDESDDFDLK